MPRTKRCIRCRQPLREDGTCKNPKCVRYVPEENIETQEIIESTEYKKNNRLK